MNSRPSPTDEIRAVRHMLAEKFGNDLQRIIDDLRQQQRESGREYIRLPKRMPVVNRSVKAAH